MEVRDALSLGRQALSGKTEHFARDVALLLAHALGCTVEDVYLHPERVVTPQEYDAYLYFLKRRINKAVSYTHLDVYKRQGFRR